MTKSGRTGGAFGLGLGALPPSDDRRSMPGIFGYGYPSEGSLFGLGAQHVAVPTWEWPDMYGTRHKFSVYPVSDVPTQVENVIYILAIRSAFGVVPKYIGQTGQSILQRSRSEWKGLTAIYGGANEIHLGAVSDERTRKQIEKNLIETYGRTLLNEMDNPYRGPGLAGFLKHR